MNIEDTLAGILAQQEITNSLLQTLIEKTPTRRKSPAKAKAKPSEQAETPLEDTFSVEKYIGSLQSLIASGKIERDEVIEAKKRENIDRLSAITTQELADYFNTALRKVIVDKRGSELTLGQLDQLIPT